MGEDTHTTTVEVKGGTYTALDRLKDQGQSFNSVIQDLIENTAAGMDGLTADPPNVETGEIERIPEDAEAYRAAKCAEFDAITGETCDQAVEYRQPYSFGEDDDGDYFYYCPEHVPGSHK